MAGATDHKRYIDTAANPEFARTMATWFAGGRIPPFAIVFPETRVGYIADKDKVGKEIIQFGFVVTDSDCRVLPHTRSPFGSDTPAGHTITTGCSILVSWSPVIPVSGRLFPQSEDDILSAARCEIPWDDRVRPTLNTLGLVRRPVTLKSGDVTCYYFYLFELQYPAGGPRGEHLVKDHDDYFFPEFRPVDDDLISSVQDKKVDLRAIEALTGRDLSGFDYGTSQLTVARGDAPFAVRPPGVFISHSSRDKTFVRRLAQRLSDAGIPTWVDHDDLHYGDVWFQRAFEAIKYCQAFAVVCSSNSARSENVADEIRWACERAQWLAERSPKQPYPVIPIILEGERAETFVPEQVRAHHGPDFRDPDQFDMRATELITQLRRVPGIRGHSYEAC